MTIFCIADIAHDLFKMVCQYLAIVLYQNFEEQPRAPGALVCVNLSFLNVL